MDPVTMLVTALAAGAAAGVAETATTAAKDAARDAYDALKQLVKARFTGDQQREMVLAQHEQQPDVWRALLAQAVAESGAATDPAVVEAAQRLLALLDEAGARAGKYTVDVRGAHGVQVGDRNTQTNTFTTPPQVP